MGEELIMLTQDDVANLLHCNVITITMLREVGVLPAIKTGRNYMFTKEDIVEFQKNYKGLDVSNRLKAEEALKLVNSKTVSV